MAKIYKKVDLEKNSSIFGLFLLSITVFILGALITKSLIEVIQFNGRVISARRELQQDIETNLDNNDLLTENYTKLIERGLGPDVLFQIMSTDYDFAGFASAMNIVALDSGVELESITPQSALISESEISNSDNASPEPFEVGVGVRGNYQSITRFIKNLQDSAAPIEYSTIEISGEDDELVADIVLTSYFQQRVGVELGGETIR